MEPTHNANGKSAKRVSFASTISEQIKDPSENGEQDTIDAGMPDSVTQDTPLSEAPASSSSLAPFAEKFQSRMDAVFGSLGGSEQGTWSLNPAQAFRPGKDVPAAEADDQDDDDEMEVAKSTRRPLMSGDVWAADDDEEGGAGVCDPSVSHQFRQAFEDEQEADEFDHLAATAFEEGRGGEARPARHMEVADDNVFDRMCHARDAGAVDMDAPAPMEVEDQPPPVQNLKTALVTEKKRPKEKRRVRFNLDNLTDEGGDEGTASKAQKATESSNPSDRHRTNGANGNTYEGSDRELSHEQSSTSDRNEQQQEFSNGQRGFADNRGGRGQRFWRRGGRHVPDHVRNPQKWTCYTLDDGIYVGHGGRNESEREQQQAVPGSEAAAPPLPGISESDPLEDSEPRFDPSTASNITFRRKEAQPKMESEKEPKPKSGVSPMLGSLHDMDAEDLEATGMEQQDTGAQAATFSSSSRGRQRHLRTKKSAQEDEETGS